MTETQMFDKYLELLLDWNERINLTAIRDAEGIRERHFLDSLRLFDACSLSGKSVIDVGSGAGFPGLPLRIHDDSVKLTLLEATGKKTAFLRTVCDALGLDDVDIVNMRAEAAGKDVNYRQRFDVATARGVSALAQLCELCLPLVRVGGVMLAMKETADELPSALSAIAALGGEAGGTYQYALNGGKQHCIIKINKIKPTYIEYPRIWGKIKKEPL